VEEAGGAGDGGGGRVYNERALRQPTSRGTAEAIFRASEKEKKRTHWGERMAAGVTYPILIAIKNEPPG